MFDAHLVVSYSEGVKVCGGFVDYSVCVFASAAENDWVSLGIAGSFVCPQYLQSVSLVRDVQLIGPVLVLCVLL